MRKRGERNVGLPGRLSKGAGTHLASWLQLVSNISDDEAEKWISAKRHERTAEVLKRVQESHGKNLVTRVKLLMLLSVVNFWPRRIKVR